MRSIFRFRAVGAALLALALLAAACGDSESGDGATTTAGDPGTTTSTAAEPDGPTIVVSSFNFNESQILAELYAQALEANNYPVERKLNLGSREIMLPALENGEVGLVPEYIGTLLTFLGGTASADSASTHAALFDAAADKGLTFAGFTPAQDKNGLVVTRAFADERNVSTTSDLAQFNGELVFGGPPECPSREFCLIGLTDVYGLDFAEFKPLDVGGPLTVAALVGGEIDVGLLFTSDGVIAANDFVLLEDDQGLQPAENVTPALRQEIVDAYGQDIIDLLDRVSAAVTQEALTEMNRRAGVDQEDPADIARDFLEAEGLI